MQWGTQAIMSWLTPKASRRLSSSASPRRSCSSRALAVEQLETRLLLSIVPANKLDAGLRTPFPFLEGEGYLAYWNVDRDASGAPKYGQERTGGITLKHPSRQTPNVPPATADPLGYDEGWNWVQVRGTVVQESAPNATIGKHRNGGTGALDRDAIRSDFDFANQFYSSIGISVVIPPDQLIEREFANVPIPLPDVGKSIIADYSGWDGVGAGDTCVEAYSPNSPSIY